MNAKKRYFMFVLVLSCLLMLLLVFKTENLSTKVYRGLDTNHIITISKTTTPVIKETTLPRQKPELLPCPNVSSLLGKFTIEIEKPIHIIKTLCTHKSKGHNDIFGVCHSIGYPL